MKKSISSTNWLRLMIILPAFAFWGTAHAQTTVFADPAVGSFDITNTNNISINANTLTGNVIYKLKFFVLNLSQLQTIPDGTAYVRIGLGSTLTIDPTYNLLTAPFNNYFTFSTFENAGQTEIYCLLHAPLPANFAEDLIFNVKARATGPSTISGNFLVNNGNPLYILSDVNPGNNSASLQYNVVANTPLPVNITKFAAENSNCRINVSWTSEQESGVDRYEVEASKDGTNFFKVAEVSAQSRTNYGTSFPITDAVKAPVLQLRLKSVDADGHLKYTSVVTVAGTCNSKAQSDIYGYPNPLAIGTDHINIATKGELFKGTYKISLTDISGKVYTVKEMVLNNVSSFRYELGVTTARGKYFIRMQKTDGTDNALIQFEKL